jgi:hypothetical protein
MEGNIFKKKYWKAGIIRKERDKERKKERKEERKKYGRETKQEV